MPREQNPQYSPELAVAEAIEVQAVSQDFITVLGEQNELLGNHTARFEKVYSSVADVLEGEFREFGYHCLRKHKPEESAIESNHPIEHAKAGVVRLSALRNIITGASEFENPKEEIFKVFGKSEDEGINSSSYTALSTLLKDETRFNNLIEDQILISLMHDVAENQGREEHEDKAKRLMLELTEQFPERFKHLKQEIYTIVNSTGDIVEMSRLDYILIGIDGSKLSTTVPPLPYENDFIVTNRDGSVTHTVPKEIANSLLGRMARVITETSDWERLSALEYYDTAFLDESLDDNFANLKQALLRNPRLLLVAEGLIENRFAYLSGGDSASRVQQSGGVVSLLRGGDQFYATEVHSKMAEIDSWIEKAGLERTLIERFGLFDLGSNERGEKFSDAIEKASNELLMRRSYQTALLLLSNGEYSASELAQMSTDELKISFNRAKTEEEKHLIQERIRDFISPHAEAILYYSGNTDVIVKALVLSDELNFPTNGQFIRADLVPGAMGLNRARYIMHSKVIGVDSLAENGAQRAETLEIFVMPPAQFVKELLDPNPPTFTGRKAVADMTTYDVAKLILRTLDPEQKALRPAIFDKTLNNLSEREIEMIGERVMDNARQLASSQERELTIKDLILSKMEGEVTRGEMTRPEFEELKASPFLA